MIVQSMLFILGATAVWLVGSKDKKLRYYGYWVGLASQPFWVFSAFAAQQYGILLLTFWYTYAWIRGIRNHKPTDTSSV